VAHALVHNRHENARNTVARDGRDCSDASEQAATRMRASEPGDVAGASFAVPVAKALLISAVSSSGLFADAALMLGDRL
jgi:hypothetical protein